MLSRTGFLHKN